MYAIGVDEKRFLTQIVDLDRGRLLDMVEGRSRHAEPMAHRTRRRLMRPDPVGDVGPVRRVPGRPRGTPPSGHVGGGPFHAIGLANRAIDECRRRVQNQTLGHRGHKSDPLYRARRVLSTAYERLTPNGSSG